MCHERRWRWPGGRQSGNRCRFDSGLPIAATLAGGAFPRTEQARSTNALSATAACPWRWGSRTGGRPAVLVSFQSGSNAEACGRFCNTFHCGRLGGADCLTAGSRPTRKRCEHQRRRPLDHASSSAPCLLISEDLPSSKHLAECRSARASDSLHVDGVHTAGSRPRGARSVIALAGARAGETGTARCCWRMGGRRPFELGSNWMASMSLQTACRRAGRRP